MARQLYDRKLDRLVEDDRRLAEEGLVELLEEDGGRHYKRLDQLSPEDVPARLQAEQAKINLLSWRLGKRLGRDGAAEASKRA